MSKDFESFWRRLAVRTSFAVKLSVDMWVPLSGCGWLSSDSVVMVGTAFWPLMKMPPVSASAAEETTFGRVLQMTWMALLSGGRPEVALLRYNILPTQLRAWGRTRYAASDYILRIMSLAWDRTTSSG